MSEQMRKLDRLVGTWQLSGGAKGTVRFEWMAGGSFLLQHVDLVHDGQQVTGLEVIGHEWPFGGEPSEEIKSRFYDSTGNTLDYVYEVHDDGGLTIWGGEKGSPAYCRSTVSEDGTTITSSWVWPGGGYDTIGTRTAG
ncbi:hypothetical protein ETD86_52585 [Nonomuraea turkmeniaca]|uniref:DUF1579 domain-containing protein n=1 Tax=Nonomuraea turkmeniaca TaxID=103838 RepID=A0A5S4EUX3_9ACTN|nr:hypothetical protein [Nonomuraea turkmeniaca]TMR06586.1 hypothetical protein ETD86_52585 [Nonomuraea turkmeniaca]